MVLVLAAAAALPSLVAWLYFFALNRDGVPGVVRTAVPVAVRIVEVAFPLAFVVVLERRRPRLSPPRRDGLALGLGFGFFVAAGILTLYFGWLRESSLLRPAATPVLQFLQNTRLDSALGFLALAAAIIVVGSLFEEYYFRWFLFGRMRALLPLPVAVVLSALVFMAHHVILLSFYLPGQFWTLAVPLSLGIAVGGGYWAWLYARTGSLYASWLSHAIVDAAILVVGWDLTRPLK
jgi:membrane protease YdiL (CAAX protease family)